MTYDPNDPATPVDLETRPAPERATTTGWVVAAIVAVVAIIAVAFMVNSRPADLDQNQIAAATEQGRTQGALEAQASINAQTAANAQALNAQIAAERAADATAQAAADARDSADQAAMNAADAARDANARIAAEQAGQPAPVTPLPQ